MQHFIGFIGRHFIYVTTFNSLGITSINNWSLRAELKKNIFLFNFAISYKLLNTNTYKQTSYY